MTITSDGCYNCLIESDEDDLMMVDSPGVEIQDEAPPAAKKRKLSDDDSAPTVKKSKVSEGNGDGAQVIPDEEDIVVL